MTDLKNTLTIQRHGDPQAAQPPIGTPLLFFIAGVSVELHAR